VVIEPPEVTGDGTLRVARHRIGLTEAQVHELSATIGRSSKRDELGLRPARVPRPVRHRPALVLRGGGRDRGPHARRRCADGPLAGPRRRPVRGARLPADQRPAQGTTVTLRPRRDAEQWLTGPTVTELARLYGSLLPVAIQVGDQDGITASRRGSAGPPSGPAGLRPGRGRRGPVRHGGAERARGRAGRGRVHPAGAGQSAGARRSPGLPEADAAGRERGRPAARLGVLRPLRGRHDRVAAHRQP
jgi:molecular chaperone HtpG